MHLRFAEVWLHFRTETRGDDANAMKRQTWVYFVFHSFGARIRRQEQGNHKQTEQQVRSPPRRLLPVLGPESGAGKTAKPTEPRLCMGGAGLFGSLSCNASHRRRGGCVS